MSHDPKVAEGQKSSDNGSERAHGLPDTLAAVSWMYVQPVLTCMLFILLLRSIPAGIGASTQVCALSLIFLSVLCGSLAATQPGAAKQLLLAVRSVLSVLSARLKSRRT